MDIISESSFPDTECAAFLPERDLEEPVGQIFDEEVLDGIIEKIMKEKEELESYAGHEEEDDDQDAEDRMDQGEWETAEDVNSYGATEGSDEF